MEILLKNIDILQQRKTNIQKLIGLINISTMDVPIGVPSSVPSSVPLTLHPPIITPVNIKQGTYMDENIVIVNKNEYLRQNNGMPELELTTQKKKSTFVDLRYNKSNIRTNYIDRAFAESTGGKNVYLLVYGDFRYVGGGVCDITNDHMPKTQEEQIFIRTNACKIYGGNEDKIFDNRNNDELLKLEKGMNEYGYRLNKGRQYLFKHDIFKKLTGGTVYLIKDVYMLRDKDGKLIDDFKKYKPINLIYAVAPMYIKPTIINGRLFTDEESSNKLNIFGLEKIKRYQTTVDNIMSVKLPDSTKPNVLMLGKFGMGVYVINSKSTHMGLKHEKNQRDVIGEYKKHIDNIKMTVYDEIFLDLS